MSLSSSVTSDESDGDVGLLSALLVPPICGLPQHTLKLSDLSYYSAVDSSAGPTQIGSPVLHWRFGSGGNFIIKRR